MKLYSSFVRCIASVISSRAFAYIPVVLVALSAVLLDGPAGGGSGGR